MEDVKPNFANYSLKELQEAWLTIDDNAYPERAIEIYQQLKKKESETAVENPLDNAPNWFISLIQIFIRPPRFYETTFDDVLLEESNAEMKAERIKKLIAAKKSNDLMKNQ